MDRPTVREVTDRATIEMILSLRREVFVQEQKVDPKEEFDGLDGDAVQIGAFLGDELVGCGRIRFVDGKAKLERIAVLSPFRGIGIGARILDFMVRTAEGRGYMDQYLHSQTAVIGFYERQGFIPEGDVFLEAEIPHKRMVLVRRG
jgi:predicted GNAT family N-acyltransferase